MTYMKMAQVRALRHAVQNAGDYLSSGGRSRGPYTYAEKQTMAAKARALLRNLATLADLPAHGKVTTRYNAGGPAVSGEVYLSAPGIHAWIEVSCVMGAVLTFRSRREVPIDGAGTFRMVDGANNTVQIALLMDPAHVERVAANIERVAAYGIGSGR